MEETLNKRSTDRFFTPQALRRLIVPLIIEQLLLMTVGMVDIAMVASTGEAAVSGVSLVDSLNALLIQVIVALCTGGAVVVSQYMGKRDVEQARTAAKQLLHVITVVALLLTILGLLFCRQILSALFGAVAPEVMDSSLEYFIITALAYPFMALYGAGSALFRSIGNSRVSMFNSLAVNLVNVTVNAVLIFGYGMGVAGAAIGTLASRVVGAILILCLLQQSGNPLRVDKLFRPQFNGGMVKRILNIGIPNGVEGGLFQMGKVLVLNLVTTLGATEALRTAAVAANGISNSVAVMVQVPGMALSLAILTVVGQCMGAGEPEQAAHYTKKLMGFAYLATSSLSLILFFLVTPVVSIFGLGPDATYIAEDVLRIFALFSIFIWPSAFALPNALRGAGDVVYTMSISMVSMFTFRLGLSYILASETIFGIPMLNMGLQGVWLAMCIDWVVRSLFFGVRFLRGKWKQIRLI